jgi:hypothetical protein
VRDEPPGGEPQRGEPPVTGPPVWLVRTFVALAVLGLLVEVAVYAGAIGGR